MVYREVRCNLKKSHFNNVCVGGILKIRGQTKDKVRRRSVGERKWKEEGEVFTLSFIRKKVRFDRTALFYCKLRKQSVKDSGIKSSPH